MMIWLLPLLTFAVFVLAVPDHGHHRRDLFRKRASTPGRDTVITKFFEGRDCPSTETSKNGITIRVADICVNTAAGLYAKQSLDNVQYGTDAAPVPPRSMLVYNNFDTFWSYVDKQSSRVRFGLTGANIGNRTAALAIDALRNKDWDSSFEYSCYNTELANDGGGFDAVIDLTRDTGFYFVANGPGMSQYLPNNGAYTPVVVN